MLSFFDIIKLSLIIIIVFSIILGHSRFLKFNYR